MISRTLVVVLLMCSNSFADEEKSRILFDFADATARTQWQAVNDGVMGGRSDGRFRIAKERSMEFFGTLSLENVSKAGPVNPEQVNSIGFLLGDKKAGPFKLEIDWIKAVSATASNGKQADGST